MHYDPPPPLTLTDLDGMRRRGEFRFANRLRAYVDVEDGRITGCGYTGDKLMGLTPITAGPLRVMLPTKGNRDIQWQPAVTSNEVTFVQTAGGRPGFSFLKPTWRWPFLVTKPFTIWTTLKLTIDVDLVEGRSAGGTGDPNFFAAYQIVALPLMLALLSRASRPWQRALVYAAILVIIGSVLTSVSRGGLLTLIAVTLIICALPARSLFHFRRQKAAFVAMVAVGAAISLAAAANEILPRVESVFRPSSSANAETEGSGRLVFWSAAWMSVKERPVLGLGFGSFPRVSNELIVRTPGVNFQHFELRPKGSQVHNAYLGTLAELGVVGLALFLGLLISTALALRRTARKARRAGAYFVMRVANALLLSLFGWSIASIFLSSETSRPLWIVIGLSLALPKLIPDEAAPEGSAA